MSKETEKENIGSKENEAEVPNEVLCPNCNTLMEERWTHDLNYHCRRLAKVCPKCHYVISLK